GLCFLSLWETGLSEKEQMYQPESLSSSKVFINGKWMGVHPTPKIIVHQLGSLRRMGKLNPEISIAILPFSNVRSEVHIQTDTGRIYRPLLIVDDKKLKLIQDILEKLSNKKTCLLLKMGSSLIQPITGETFSEFLSNKGYHKHREEVLYDGATGIKLNATVFMGVNIYQRLKHIVDDKLNIRNRGAVTQLKGQPKRVLTRDGGR
ncbi:unnamed protein product, partial [Allacma fusca]